jgi:hypothetical protein
MDYGGGGYPWPWGPIQYHPANRPQVCFKLTAMVNTNCPYFTAVKPNTACGDGMLDVNEECECLNGSQSCGVCQSCKVTNPAVQCSASVFVFRNIGMPAQLVSATTDMLADPACCVNHRFPGPKKYCGTGNLDVCGAYGACQQVCTLIYSAGTKNCGFDQSG